MLKQEDLCLDLQHDVEAYTFNTPSGEGEEEGEKGRLLKHEDQPIRTPDSVRWLSIPVIIFCKSVAEVPGQRAISHFRVEPGDKTLRKVSQWGRMIPGWLGLFLLIPQQPASSGITVLGSEPFPFFSISSLPKSRE